jgi:hypothetical protein
VVSGTGRYVAEGTWYKGNTHIHSTQSDGGLTFEQLETAYGGAGYDFLFRTDHWVASTLALEGGASKAEPPLLWLDGIELDGFDKHSSYYHVVCLGTFDGIEREMGFPAALASARAQGGLLILAHPFWTGNSCAEVVRWGFDGVEIYNHVCQWLNGKGDGRPYWEMMLREAPQTLAFASDDAHITASHPGWNGGWVMVQAPELTAEAIMASLRAGRFYSSSGPEFHEIRVEDGTVSIETSPVSFARLVGPGSRGQRLGSFDGQTLERARFSLPEDWRFVYVEIEDAMGRRAWTNTLWVAD